MKYILCIIGFILIFLFSKVFAEEKEENKYFIIYSEKPNKEIIIGRNLDNLLPSPGYVVTYPLNIIPDNRIVPFPYNSEK